MTRGADSRAARVLLPVLGVGSLVALWAIASAAGWVPASSLPSPDRVVRRLPELLGTADYRDGVRDTLTTYVIALGGTALIAIPVGLVVGSIDALARPVMRAVDALRSVPSTALIPVAILFFGLGMQMKLSLAMYATAWPVLINTVYGVHATEPMRLDVARSLRWTWFQRQVRVILPSALPSILTGLRVGSGIALVVIVSAELLGAGSGVGVVIVRYQQAVLPELVYAGVIVIGAIGATLYALMVRIERKVVTWAPR